MQTIYKRYHHFKGKNLTRSEKIQKKIVELLLQSKVSDSKLDSSIIFELKYHSECVQVARILAQIRKLDIELAEIAAALHDVQVIVNGGYKNHAALGAVIAQKILQELGGFSKQEISTIYLSIKHHSEKDIYSNNPYIELIKDADVFDCSLFENSEDEYRITKSPALFKEYARRIRKVRKELGLPITPVFRK